MPPDIARVIEVLVPCADERESAPFLTTSTQAAAEQLSGDFDSRLAETVRAVQNMLSPSLLEARRAMLEQTKLIAPALKQWADVQHARMAERGPKHG